MIWLLISLVASTLQDRYNQMSVQQAMNIVPHLVSKQYDSLIADSWFGYQPFLNPSKPTIIGFTHLFDSYDNAIFIKTLALLQQDLYQFDVFMVDLSSDNDWIAKTLKVNEQCIVLVLKDQVYRMD